MGRVRPIVCAAVWLLTAASAVGGRLPDAQVDQVGNDVPARLGSVEELLKGGQWSEAVDGLLQVMENWGERLIRVPAQEPWEAGGFARFVPVREYVQMELAAWHRQAPEALAAYRRRVDPIAERWYKQATAERDEPLLVRLADQFLLSSVGDDALLRLGDLALERADQETARRCWRQLSPQFRVTPIQAKAVGGAAGGAWFWTLVGRDIDTVWSLAQQAGPAEGVPVGWLACPDPSVSLPAVWARLALASLLAGDRPRAERERAWLERFAPDAAGWLAGGEGNYSQRLGAVLEQSRTWAAIPEPDWTTLGGNPARNKVAPRPIDPALRPIWQVALPRLQSDQDVLAAGRVRVGERADGLLSYHVAVRDGVVYVHQPGVLRALQLATGKPVWPLPTAGPAGNAREGEIYAWSRATPATESRSTPVAGVTRYCVTVAGDHLVARMGVQGAVGEGLSGNPQLQPSFLMGLDLRTQKVLFDRIVLDESGWQFEAAPVADAARVYITARRRDQVSSQVSVHCYSLGSGRLVWRTDLARATPLTDARVELTHSPLTLGDGTLYYNSNLGVVAALDVDDGGLRWVCRYPRRGLRDDDPDRDDRHVFRDLTPCLLHEDLVIVAPADSDRILALDAATGQVLWVTPAGQAADAVHLLGVGGGHLLAGGDALYWIDVATGSVVGRFPAAVSPGNEFARPAPRGYGRGVLAGPWVYWPTYERLYVFDQRQPRLVRQPIDLAAAGLTGGNLVIAEDTLLIAAADRLSAWTDTGTRPADRPGSGSSGR